MALPEINQAWFEMTVLRGRSYNSGTVWIPLRANEVILEDGQSGHIGYINEYFSVGSIAVRVAPAEADAPKPKTNILTKILERFKKPENEWARKPLSAEDLDWGAVSFGHSHSSWIRDDGKYVASDEYDNGFDSIGLRLVIDQFIEGDRYNEWYVHHDLIIALGLRREGDVWLDPARGYIEVIRLRRNEEGNPCHVEIRANYLKDYLAARKMRLRIAYFRQHTAVLANRDCVDWKEDLVEDTRPENRWEGRIAEIHQGGMPFGQSITVFQSGRTEVDDESDVPNFEMDEGFTSSTWTKEFDGEKLYRIMGESWREEWIEPADSCPIVSRDEPESSVQFIVNEKNEKETSKSLVHGVRWLWFRPEVVPALLAYRGSGLGWHTRFTGSIGCSPLNGVHFGINHVGLVNVFAKDIGKLPEWQQQVWVAYNVGPEGGVSPELMAAQNRAQPADTLAPEPYLGKILDRLDEICLSKFGFKLFQEHSYVEELLPKVHRFRSLNEDGLRALAKDIARLVADRIEAPAIQKIVKPPKGEKWAGLKSLEQLLATKVKPEVLETLMAPLYGIYYLRVGDAHLPSEGLAQAKTSARVDTSKPYVFQGFGLLDVCVKCLVGISMVLEKAF